MPPKKKTSTDDYEEMMKEFLPKLLEVVRSIRPDPKLVPFEGSQTEDISMWFKDFRRSTGGLGRSDDYLLNLAKQNIKGSAKIFLNQIPEEDVDDLDKLEKEMTRLFGRKLTPEDYKDKLFALKFEDFDSIDDLAQNISILVPNAYPKRVRADWDETMRDFFLTVLPINIRSDIKHANPKDFCAAIKEAKYFIDKNKTAKRKVETLTNTELEKGQREEGKEESCKRLKTADDSFKEINHMYRDHRNGFYRKKHNYDRNRGKWFIQRKINNRMKYPYRNYDYDFKRHFQKGNNKRSYQDNDNSYVRKKYSKNNADKYSSRDNAKVYGKYRNRINKEETPSSKSISTESLNFV